MNWVDMIFDKKDFETYFYSIIHYFKHIVDNHPKKEIENIFIQLKWTYDFNVDFYMMSKAYNMRPIISDKEKLQSKQVYLELLDDIKD